MTKFSELLKDYIDSREEELSIDAEWDPIFNRQGRAAWRESLLEKMDAYFEQLKDKQP